MKNLVVSKKYDGKKLDKFLYNNFPDLASGTFYKALRKKDIIVNNVRISKNITVNYDDKVRIYISDNLLYKKVDFNIIYEDSYIIIINKPVGIEVTGKNSLTKQLQLIYGNGVLPCHRLDRNTSGLILFSKTENAQKILLDKFKKHEIEKHYLAKVYGIPKKNKATLVAYLFKDSKKSLVYISNNQKKGYKKIITSYQIIKKGHNFSLLDINLKTGKTHQIRAHLAHIGYPIIGDRKIWY